MNRRNFITKTGLSIGATSLISTIGEAATKENYSSEWEAVRAQFPINKEKIQMAQMLLASHPKSVQEAITKHRKGLDENPVEYVEHNLVQYERDVLAAAGKYLSANPRGFALTDSTTMGLSMLYCGFDLKEGDDVLTTTHGHYSSETSLKLATSKSGATLRQIDLFENPATVTKAEIIDNLQQNILPKTRIVAVTYVHSSSGLKLPIPEMSAIIQEANQKRNKADRIYFCVDAVHGFGVEDIKVTEFGCDFLVAGTHKWLFGPRGTGLIWAKEDAWDMVNPIIPPFSIAFYMWMDKVPKRELDFYSKITPGGYHSFEHRWALNEAFNFHMSIGKEKIQNRTHHLNSMLKEGLQSIDHIKIHTPISTDLSSGITCFDVDGMAADQVTKKLYEKNIIASNTPYKTVYARLTPSVINTEAEVMECIKALEDIK